MNFYNDLASLFGTPLYIYDLESISYAYKKLRSSLPKDSILFYSFKANPNFEIVKHLINLGCWAEVSSKKEIELALKSKIDKKKILFSGPGKTDAEIMFAILNDINHFSVESVDEMLVIKRFAEEFQKYISITLRITPKYRNHNARLNMASYESQFGIEESLLSQSILKRIESKFLLIQGIHIYTGSNFENISNLMENFIYNIEAAKRVCSLLNINLRFLDIGGGFSAPYAQVGELMNYKDLKKGLEKCIVENFGKEVSIAFESGRYLTATSGVIVGTVLNNKKTEKKNICVIDFGINTLSGMSGIRKLLSPNVDLIPLKEFRKDEPMFDSKLVGPLCTPLDCIDNNIKLPIFKRGDRFIIPNVGAYGLTASLVGFLSRETPNEVIIRGKEILSICKYVI